MGEVTKIEWTDHTFNPWIGCTKESPGCKNCYAETQNKLYHWTGGGWGPGAPRKITSDSNWSNLRKWDRAAGKAGKMALVFVASLADFFDTDAPAGQRERFYAEADACPNLFFLILTKRPQNWENFLPVKWLMNWPANVKLGFTAEDQTRLEQRLEHAAALRRQWEVPMFFVSYEPAIGPIELVLSCAFEHVDWVICGGESGPGARPMHPEWARTVRDECEIAGVPFFFKQWGEWVHRSCVEETRLDNPKSLHYFPEMDATFARVGKKAAGSQLEGCTWKQFPKVAR